MFNACSFLTDTVIAAFWFVHIIVTDCNRLPPGMLQGQFWKLLDSLKIANFGYFLQTKVTTFGNFIKQCNAKL